MRRPRYLNYIFSLLLVAAVLLLPGCSQPGRELVVINGIEVPPVPTLDATIVVVGGDLYKLHCAQCHGTNLEGAPDWTRTLPDGSFPAPPHDSSGHTWHHPDSILMGIITEGGNPAFGGTMPGFEGQLTEAEKKAILDFIKSKWGKNEREFQWLITAQGQ